MEAHPKCPTLYYVREADGVIELHVDDGHECGKETVIAELLSFLSEKIEMKVLQGIKCGSYEYLKTVKVRDGKKLTSIPNKKHLQSALKKLEMSDCKGSVSPKLDKSCIEGDGEELGEEQASRFRSAVLTLLYLSNERTDIQSTVRLLCTKLKSPTVLEMRQLKRLLRYVKSTEDMSTVFEMRDNSDRRGRMVKRLEVYTDSDWASDQVTRKSTSGAVIMAEGMRLHAHSRGQASVALSSCEAEVMAASEGIKEALLLQEVLMFVGLGKYEIEVKVDSSAAHAFFHRRGVGRMKHIDSRILWLQDLIWKSCLEELFGRVFWKSFLEEFFGRVFWKSFLEEFFGRVFLEEFFGRVFWKSFLEEFFGRVFWKSFLEEFFGRVFWKSFL